MSKQALALVVATLSVLAALPRLAASPAEIKVLTAGAMRGLVDALRPQFERQSGLRVVVDNATAGVLAKRIAGGEAFDAVIITSTALQDLIAQGRIVPQSRVELAKVGMGVVVKRGAPLPDIATVDAFKRTLLAAKSVAYIDPRAGGTTGVYFDALLARLGIADAIRPKAKLKDGGHVADLVASGEAEIGVHVISEIKPVKGVTLVGPLPQAIQHTTVYAAGVAAAASDAAGAQALLKLLAGEASAPILAENGMERP
jgi:molybdate transport system substrate-binding protein